RALDEPADAGAPPRHHHSCAAGRAAADRQSAGAAAQPPEGGVRAVSGRQHHTNKNAPAEPGRFRIAASGGADHFLRKPSNFFWKRETRPPRSSSCWVPPVQAGCDLGSISRFSLSPSLPQVERVWYSVPSVITTVII